DPRLHHRIRRRLRQEGAPANRGGDPRGFVRRVRSVVDRPDLQGGRVELLMNARMLVPDRATLALAIAVGAAYLILGAPLPLALLTAALVCLASGVLEAALSYRRSPRPLPGPPEPLWVFRPEAAVA